MALEPALVGFLKHLLKTESWARDRLRPYAGTQVVLQTGFVDIRLLVDGEGYFTAGSDAMPSAVSVSLSADTPFRFLTDRQSIFQTAKLSGSADFAEALAFVFRNLHWDVEADLAELVGDIPARRLEMLRQQMFLHGRESSIRFFQNLAEFATEDSNWLASQQEVQEFGSLVNTLRDDVARLEKRLAGF